MQLRSGRALPEGPHAKRQRRLPLRAQELDEVQFKPQHGDIIIREIPHTSSNKIISSLNLIRIYNDPNLADAQNLQKSPKFEFRQGDHILRLGRLRPFGSDNPYVWTYINDRISLYLYWSRLWFRVAGTAANPPMGPPPAPDTTFPGPFVWNGVFSVVRWDYIIHVEPSAVKWGRNYVVRIAPSRALDDDELRANLADNEPRLYGTGDVVVRIRRLNPLPLELNDKRKFVAMFAYGFLCLGGENPNVYTYRWRYLGMDQETFRDHAFDWHEIDPQAALGALPHHVNWHGLHPAAGVVAIRNPDSGDSPVRPGDIVFNLDRSLQRISTRITSPIWIGGHVILYPDGPVKEFPQRFYGSAILRLGDFSQDPVKDFSSWEATPVHLFIQEQVSDPTRWIQVVREVVQIGNGIGTYPSVDEEFKALFPNPDNIELGDKQINFEPRTTDLIISTTIWDDHIKMVHGYPPEQGQEGTSVVRLGPPTWNEGPNRIRDIASLDKPEDMNKSYQCFFWFPGYQGKDQDCLFRFGSEPTQERRDRGGNWVLRVELYTFGLVTPLIFTDNGPNYIGHWALRGVDRRVYPASQAAPEL